MWRWLTHAPDRQPSGSRSRGLVDPVEVLSRLESLAQPLEIQQPPRADADRLAVSRPRVVEYRRHPAQSGLDLAALGWKRQFDPARPGLHSALLFADPHQPDAAQLDGYRPCRASTICRSSISRGLLTPFWDGWSLDVWILADDGRRLIPSRLDHAACHQMLDFGEWSGGGDHEPQRSSPSSRPAPRSKPGTRGRLPPRGCRPRRPPGVAGAGPAALQPGRRQHPRSDRASERTTAAGWSTANIASSWAHPPTVFWQRTTSRVTSSLYYQMANARRESSQQIRAGDLRPLCFGSARMLRIRSRCGFRWGPPASVPQASPSAPDGPTLSRAPVACGFPTPRSEPSTAPPCARWCCIHLDVTSIPDRSPTSVSGSVTRPFILHGMLCAGLTERALRCLASFPERQTASGHFFSQEAEWDSNGEALWIMRRYCELTGQPPPAAWRRSVRRGARWNPPQAPGRDAGLPPCRTPAPRFQRRAPGTQTTITTGTISGAWPGCGRRLTCSPPGVRPRKPTSCGDRPIVFWWRSSTA